MMIQKVVQTRFALLGALLAALVVLAVVISDSVLNDMGTWVLIVMLLPANYFPIFYTVAFRWWGGHLGRALFIKALGLAVVLDTALMVKYFGGETWSDEVRFVAYSLVLVGMFYQSVVMTSIRLRAGKAHASHEGEDTEHTDLRGVDMRPEAP